MPTPTAKSASIIVTTCSFAKSTSLANTGRPDTTMNAKSQNQDVARIGSSSCGRVRHVTDDGDRVVEQTRTRRLAMYEGGAVGICRAASQPRSALTTPQTPTIERAVAEQRDAAAEDRAEQDREERAGLDQRVAGDQLVLVAGAAAAVRT